MAHYNYKHLLNSKFCSEFKFVETCALAPRHLCQIYGLKKSIELQCMYNWIAYQLLVGTLLGRLHHLVRYQIRDHFWIPQPKLQVVMYLILFVKP